MIYTPRIYIVCRIAKDGRREYFHGMRQGPMTGHWKRPRWNASREHAMLLRMDQAERIEAGKGWTGFIEVK